MRSLRPPLPVLAVMGLGAANFLWQLGSSSYFVDEVLSIQHSLPSLGAVTSMVTRTETTPWTYFWGLHGWLHLTGSQSEWVTRLPEALAGVALVGAVYWMTLAFAGRRASLLAALLTSLSPLVLTYAQRTRVYVFVLLALTIAVGLAVRAAQERPHATRRLVWAGVAAILALWLHYTALLVVAPLCVWLAMQRSLTARARIAFAGVCGAGALVELPLFLRQYHYAPNGGVGAGGGITGLNVVRVLETPFDGRFVSSVNAFRILALVALAVAAAALAGRAGGKVRSPRLLLALGIAPPLFILVLGLAGKDVVITRYTVVAAPMLLAGIGAVAASLPRLPAVLLALASITASVWGLARVHERTGFYPPARETVDYLREHPEPSAVVALPGHPGADIPLAFYAQRLLRPLPPFIETTDHAAVVHAFHERHPLWFVVERRSLKVSPAALRRFLDRAVQPYGYITARVRPIATSSTFVAELFTPRPGTASHRPGGTP